jgi:hypothetical protein
VAASEADALWKTCQLSLWFEPRGCTNETSTEALHLLPLNRRLYDADNPSF